MTVSLRNPHSVLATLETRPDDVLEIRLSGGKPHGAWQEVVEIAERRRISVGVATAPSDQRRRPRHGPAADAGRTAAAEAIVRERADVPLERLFAREKIEQSPHGIWLALDQLQDPHNVGAIFRTAAFYDVRGIVLLRDRAAPLTGTVYDVASGGVERVPFSMRPNLAQALEVAKEAGLWVLGSSEHAEKDVSQVPRDRPWLLVVGNEERGLRQLTLKTCDEVCRLTPRGLVTSLNVSVASAILIAALTVTPTSGAG